MQLLTLVPIHSSTTIKVCIYKYTCIEKIQPSRPISLIIYRPKKNTPPEGVEEIRGEGERVKSRKAEKKKAGWKPKKVKTF